MKPKLPVTKAKQKVRQDPVDDLVARMAELQRLKRQVQLAEAAIQPKASRRTSFHRQA